MPSPTSALHALRHDLVVLAALALAAVGLGLLANRFRREPLPWSYVSPEARLQRSVARLAPAPVNQPPQPTPPPDAPTAPEMIDLAKFHDFVDRGAPILDARPSLFYGAGHVPGARNLSRAAFEADYTRLRPFLEPHRLGTLVVYCSGEECEDSRLVASALQKLGYAHLFIYSGGWEEWRQAGLPEERAK